MIELHPPVPLPASVSSAPPWAHLGAFFHIRFRLAGDCAIPLTTAATAEGLWESVRDFHDAGKWHCRLFLLLPEAAHGLLAFPCEVGMSRVIGEWKRATTARHQVRWQINYFDQGLRTPEALAREEAELLRTPAGKGLCAPAAAWPWLWAEGAQPGQ